MTDDTHGSEALRTRGSASQDDEHLRLLSVFHWVAAGLTGVMSLFGLIYVGLGFALLAGAMEHGHDAPPKAMGLIFVVMGLFVVALGLGMALCLATSARYLKEHRRHTFCLVVAGISCLSVPVGTVLGVFTILVLMRPSVRESFERTDALAVGARRRNAS